MAAFLISYDLHTPGQKYECFKTQLEVLCPRHWKPLSTTWLVNYSGTAMELFTALKKCVDANDEIFIVKLQNAAVWNGPTLTKQTQWLIDTLAH